ncbi:MAG: heparan-alpha-glucosaminide N-acetyltransferase domain-containing protein [Bacillota bacterium]
MNAGRQLELDIARGLAVLFMIIIHVQTYFANARVMDTWFAGFNDFNGGIPAAPVFMFLLGIGINYTRNNNPALMAMRGVGLLCTAYLLNFVRGFVPYAIRSYCTADIDYLYRGFDALMSVDILQFSGLAMLLFALFHKLRASNLSIALTAVLFSVWNIVLLPLQSDSLAASALSGLLWGSHANSFFPFLTWVFYPIAGYLFGSLLIRCTNKRLLYALSGLTAALVFFGGSYLMSHLELQQGSETAYYHHIVTDNIIYTGGVILELAILSFIAPFIPKSLQNIAGRLSKNVTSLYCIQWVLITWLTLVIPINGLDMAWYVALVIAIIVLSDSAATLYAQWQATEAVRQMSTLALILAGTLIFAMITVTALPDIWRVLRTP